MDVQQLTSEPSNRTSWSLRDADPAGAGPLAGSAPWWLDDAAEPRDLQVPGFPAAEHRFSRTVLAVLAAAALAVCIAAAIALLAGMRWFIVETPSMGTAAPVGSLVITTPTPAQLHTGEVIAFTPPGAPRVYTHRVFSVAADGSVRTKGDINGAADPWTIAHSKVLGKAVALIPGAGYLVRGIPPFLIGGMLLWILTALFHRRERRAAARVIGLHLVATVVLMWLHPLVQLVLIDSSGRRASIVSTGLLPIKLVDTAGVVLARLTVGRPEVVTLPAASAHAGRIVAQPDLTGLLQLGLIGLAVLPALIVLIVGMPRDEDATAVA